MTQSFPWLVGCSLAFAVWSTSEHRSIWRHVGEGLAAALCAVSAVRIVGNIISGVMFPRQWDFLCFWLAGQLLVSGGDPYSPGDYGKIDLPFPVSREFEEEILGVGLHYPPPTMLLFAPLGYLRFESAYIIWHVGILVAIAACIELCRRSHFRNEGRSGVLTSCALLLAHPSTLPAIGNGQTNFLLLALILLAYREAERPRAAVWISLATLVKPLAAAIAILPLVRRDLRALTLGLAIAAGATLAAWLAFGSGPFETYWTDPPSLRTPLWVFRQGVNQSLAAELLRWSDARGATLAERVHPLFPVLAAAMTFGAGWLAFRARRIAPQGVVALAVATALLIYPGTLSHYAMLGIVPALWLWSEARKNGTRPMILGVIVAWLILVATPRRVFEADALLLAAVGTALFAATRCQGANASAVRSCHAPER